MYWPNELANSIIQSLSITSEPMQALTVWLVLCGYGLSAVLIACALAPIFQGKK